MNHRRLLSQRQLPQAGLPFWAEEEHSLLYPGDICPLQPACCPLLGFLLDLAVLCPSTDLHRYEQTNHVVKAGMSLVFEPDYNFVADFCLVDVAFHFWNQSSVFVHTFVKTGAGKMSKYRFPSFLGNWLTGGKVQKYSGKFCMFVFKSGRLHFVLHQQ